MLFRLAAFAGVVGALSGCVAGQSIPLNHKPLEPRHELRNIEVAVAVEDKRSFIVNGDKNPDYIGHYRGGYGNPWDVTTASDDALAERIRMDLVEELENMGFTVGEPSKTLSVIIRQWNFDTYINGRFWYEIDVAVIGKGGNVLAKDTIKDEVKIKGSFWTGPTGAFEREIPRYYDQIIQDLLRGNPETLRALEST